MQFYWLFSCFVVFVGLIGCSSLSKQVAPNVAVSQKEYDVLLKRYESLQNELRDLRLSQREQTENIVNGDKMMGSEMVQTVDVFAQVRSLQTAKESTVQLPVSKPSQDSSPQVIPATQEKINFVTELSDQDAQVLESQLADLRAAQAMFIKGDHQKGLDSLKDLRKSPYRQIQVRAQFLISEGLFGQGEFDLALQGYEDIIHRNAFSGLVIKALGRLVECTEKLGIDDKKKQYDSMLHDFFGERRS